MRVEQRVKRLEQRRAGRGLRVFRQADDNERLFVAAILNLTRGSG